MGFQAKPAREVRPDVLVQYGVSRNQVFISSSEALCRGKTWFLNLLESSALMY